MPWHIQVGPNHVVEINGVKITVNRMTRITIHSEADIKVTTPSGKTTTLFKEKQNETHR